MSARAERLWLAGLLGLSLLFHLLTLSGQALFVDEVAELQHARGGWSEVAWRADSMPPLYGLLAKSWVMLFGEESHVRWLSVAASLATIPVVWRIGRRLGDACQLDPATAGIASAACFAALPQQLYYAQLIRAYSLTTFVASLGILAFLRALDSDRLRDWLTFAVAGLLGMWVHYYFAIVLLLLLGVLFYRRGWKVGRAPLLAAVAIVIGCLPLLPFLKSDFEYQRDLRDPRPLNAASIAYTGFSYFSGYTLGPTKGELHRMSGRGAAMQAAPWGLAIGLTAGVLAIVGGWRLAKAGWLTPMLLLTFGAIGAVGLLGVASGVTFNPRFVAWCAAPLAVWLGVGITAGLRKGSGLHKLTLAASLGLFSIASVAIAQRHTVDRYRTEELPSAVAWFDEQGLHDAPVFVVSDYLAPQVDFHAELAGVELSRVNALPRPGQVDQEVEEVGLAAEAIASLRGLAGDADFYLIGCREFHTDPHGLLRDALLESTTIEPIARFAGVVVYRGRLKD